MENIARATVKTVVFCVVVIVFGIFLSWPVMLLWNNVLVHAVDGVHPVTWMQAWGLLALCGILFRNSTTSSTD